jgi:hypothetical protein
VRALLTLDALLLAAPQVLHAAGEAVAQQLELLEAEQAGAAEGLAGGSGRAGEAVRRTGAGAGREARKGVGDDVRELTLEPRDLRLQRPARGALAVPPQRTERLSGALHG